MKRYFGLFGDSRFSLCAVVLICVALLGTNVWSSDTANSGYKSVRTRSQEHDRAVKKMVFKREPVKISAVKTKVGKIKLDESFLADNDWLRGFTVTVDNTSGKTITSLTVDLIFERPVNHETSKEPPLALPLTFGPSPSSPKDYARRDPSKVVKPGDSINLGLSDGDYEFLKRALAELKYPESIRGVELRITEVGFEDGTSWHGGAFFRPDPNNPDNG